MISGSFHTKQDFVRNNCCLKSPSTVCIKIYVLSTTELSPCQAFPREIFHSLSQSCKNTNTVKHTYRGTISPACFCQMSFQITVFIFVACTFFFIPRAQEFLFIKKYMANKINGRGGGLCFFVPAISMISPTV